MAIPSQLRQLVVCGGPASQLRPPPQTNSSEVLYFRPAAVAFVVNVRLGCENSAEPSLLFFCRFLFFGEGGEAIENPQL